MKINTTNDNSTQHPLVQWLEHRIRRIIRIGNVQLARCSMTWQIVICLVIVTLLAFANAGILWKAIHDHQQTSVDYEIIHFPPVEIEEEESILTQAEYEKLSQFMVILDSLQNNPQSRGIYKELMHQHPGIRDSIRYLLENYSPK